MPTEKRDVTALLLLRDLQRAVRTFDLGIGRDADSAWERVRAAEKAASTFLDAKHQPVESLLDADDLAVHAEQSHEETGERWWLDSDVTTDEDVERDTYGAEKLAELKRIGWWSDRLIGKRATIVGFSTEGTPGEAGFMAHICLDVENGARVFFEATDPAHVWRIVSEASQFGRGR